MIIVFLRKKMMMRNKHRIYAFNFFQYFDVNQVKAKKQLGQHFLTDESIAERIARSLTGRSRCLIEIGPGMGVLTKYLIGDERYRFAAVELDHESVDYLAVHYPDLRVIEGDFLRLDLKSLFTDDSSTFQHFNNSTAQHISKRGCGTCSCRTGQQDLRHTQRAALGILQHRVSVYSP